MGSARVLRGGSWYRDPWLCRSAIRHWSSPDFRVDDRGFRVVMEIEE
jgi:sulfatase modifying factor 1